MKVKSKGKKAVGRRIRASIHTHTSIHTHHIHTHTHTHTQTHNRADPKWPHTEWSQWRCFAGRSPPSTSTKNRIQSDDTRITFDQNLNKDCASLNTIQSALFISSCLTFQCQSRGKWRNIHTYTYTHTHGVASHSGAARSTTASCWGAWENAISSHERRFNKIRCGATWAYAARFDNPRFYPNNFFRPSRLNVGPRCLRCVSLCVRVCVPSLFHFLPASMAVISRIR